MADAQSLADLENDYAARCHRMKRLRVSIRQLECELLEEQYHARALRWLVDTARQHATVQLDTIQPTARPSAATGV